MKSSEKDLNKMTFEELLIEYNATPMTPEEEEQANRFAKKVLLSNKYRKGLKTIVGFHLDKLWETHPDMPLSEVVTSTVKSLNPELPGEVLLEIAGFIIEEWETKKQTEHVNEQRELMLA